MLRKDESATSGLYAASNTSVSVTERLYPGSRNTLGPVVVFPFTAVNYVAGAKQQGRARGVTIVALTTPYPPPLITTLLHILNFL